MSKKVVVDWTKCSGIGICESIAPEFYEVNDDGHLVQLRDDVDAADLDRIEKTVFECPTGALSIVVE
jgi:ferredoxin